MAGKFKFDPCGECCCENCTGGSLPDSVSVTLNGVSDGSCGNCESYDGTYVLERTAIDTFGNPRSCLWQYKFPDPQCSYKYLQFWAGNYLTGWWGVVLWLTSTDRVIWRGGTVPVSCDFDAADVPFYSNGTQCIGSGATCTITSIP